MKLTPESGVFLKAMLLIAGLATPAICQTSGPPQRAPTIQEIHEAEARMEQRADTVEKTITILAGAAIIYGVIAAVGSYASVKDARDTAKAEAARSKHDLDALQKDIAAAIPIMADVNQSLNTLLVQLRGRIPNRWHSANEQIPADVLQQIKYDEMTVAGLSLYLSSNQEPLRSKLSELHQGLGRFYGALYRQSSPRDAEVADRACFYFSKSLLIDPNNYTAYRDRAALATMVKPDSADTWSTCAVDYAACLKGKPGDARSLFGIAWSHFKMGRRDEAILEITELLKSAGQLNADDALYVLPYAYLNRAGFVLARDGDGARAFILTDCSAALKEAAANRDLDPPRYAEFCNDLKAFLTDDLKSPHDGLPQDLKGVFQPGIG